MKTSTGSLIALLLVSTSAWAGHSVCVTCAQTGLVTLPAAGAPTAQEQLKDVSGIFSKAGPTLVFPTDTPFMPPSSDVPSWITDFRPPGFPPVINNGHPVNLGNLSMMQPNPLFSPAFSFPGAGSRY